MIDFQSYTIPKIDLPSSMKRSFPVYGIVRIRIEKVMHFANSLYKEKAKGFKRKKSSFYGISGNCLYLFSSSIVLACQIIV